MDRIQRTFKQFQGIAEEHKQCPEGKYYCHKEKKCMPIPRGYYVGARGWLNPDPDENGKKNGNGYGHSNVEAFAEITDERLAELGVSRNPNDVLDAGHFQVPQTQEFETHMNNEYEQIKAGF